MVIDVDDSYDVEFDDEGDGGNRGRFYTADAADAVEEDEESEGGEADSQYLLEVPEDGSPLFSFDFSSGPGDQSGPSKAAVSMGRWNGKNIGWYTFVFTSPSSFVLNVVPVEGGKGSAFVILGTRIASASQQNVAPPPWYIRFGPSLAITAVFILRRVVGQPPQRQ